MTWRWACWRNYCARRSKWDQRGAGVVSNIVSSRVSNIYPPRHRLSSSHCGTGRDRAGRSVIGPGGARRRGVPQDYGLPRTMNTLGIAAGGLSVACAAPASPWRRALCGQEQPPRCPDAGTAIRGTAAAREIGTEKDEATAPAISWSSADFGLLTPLLLPVEADQPLAGNPQGGLICELLASTRPHLPPALCARFHAQAAVSSLIWRGRQTHAPARLSGKIAGSSEICGKIA